jgi:formate dehydrogenase major subunit
MHVDRRTFMKGTAAVGGALGLGFFDLSEARAEMRELKISRTTETRSTCPYCSVSCGSSTRSGQGEERHGSVVHVEGDPDQSINRGRCAKGITLKNDIHHPNRLTVPKVRRPARTSGRISWDAAIAGIAKRIKETRDRTFVAKNAKGEVVNRTPGFGLIGGCTDTNEFNLLQWKFGAGLGVVYRDTQARV